MLPANAIAADFITTWKTDNAGTSTANQITIPTNGSGYNYDIDWGDGSSDVGVTGDITHTYAVAGTYTVKISGAFPQIYFDNDGDKDKILSIEQWGDIAWRGMNRSFWGATNLDINAIDAPDLSNVTNINHMFRETTFDDDINHWDVSNVTNMSAIFAFNPNFNQDLDDWVVENVVTTSSMFSGATSFNGDISTWDTGMVANMASMFANATAFNGDITGWDTLSVLNLTSTFLNAVNFNQDLNDWRVDNVTTLQSTFQGATAFDQDLNLWNTANVETMRNTFRDASSFNGNIDNWITTKVASMYFTFRGASAFNRDISGWDTAMVTTMRHMFQFATSFNQDLVGWETGEVTDMRAMFDGATLFDGDINDWDTSKVEQMDFMFRNTPFNQDISDWVTGAVKNMRYMFRSATNFNQDISGWDTGMVENMQQMFYAADDFDQDIGGWNTGLVENMNSMFRFATAFDQDLGGWDVTSLDNAGNMFLNNSLSTSNYDSLLIGWNSQALINGVPFHGGTSTYCLGEAARANMIAGDGWTIADAGKECANEPPTDISIDGAGVDTVLENAAVGTVVGALTTTDPDTGDTHVYSLVCAVAGADDALFQISGTDLQTNSIFDFENPSDANLDGTYEVCVRSTDDGGPAEFYDKILTITIDNLKPNLEIQKTVSNNFPMVGEVVTFELVINNTGSDTATVIVTNDIVPAGFVYTPTSISGGDAQNDSSPAGTGLTWTIDALASGATAGTLTFTATVVAP